MTITSSKIKKVVSILLDVNECDISNIYTFSKGEYLVTFKTDEKAFLLCFKEGNFKHLI